jgi:sugar-specific transcriptional regulator TrmB
MVIKQDMLTILKRLGLNQYESKTYLALLTNGVCTASELSGVAKIPRPRQYDVLDRLEEKGFVVPTPGRPVRYKALTPSQVSAYLLKKEEESFQNRMDEIEELKKRFEGALGNLAKSTRTDVGESVWAIRGKNNIYAHLGTLIEKADAIKLMTTTEGLKTKVKMNVKNMKKAKERGATIQILAPPGDHNARVKDVATLRNIDNDIMRYGIFDDKESLFLLTPEKTHHDAEVGLWVSSPLFSKAISEVFDAKWKEAK